MLQRSCPEESGGRESLHGRGSFIPGEVIFDDWGTGAGAIVAKRVLALPRTIERVQVGVKCNYSEELRSGNERLQVSPTLMSMPFQHRIFPM